LGLKGLIGLLPIWHKNKCHLGRKSQRKLRNGSVRLAVPLKNWALAKTSCSILKELKGSWSSNREVNGPEGEEHKGKITALLYLRKKRVKF